MSIKFALSFGVALMALPLAACARDVTPAEGSQAAPAISKPAIPDGYTLVWSDEFDKEGAPDKSKWAYDTYGNRSKWWHNELQYYSDDRRENARIVDGKLVIEARTEMLHQARDWVGQEYTSARLYTKGKANWTYGFFDVRAKLPCGRGTWPAIWLLTDAPYKTWPDGGEIDIMEQVGHEPGKIHGTLHSKDTVTRRSGYGGTVDLADSCDAFHNYQLDWRQGSITFLVDGQPYYTKSRLEGGMDIWPYDHDFYMILNVAIGGVWGGQKGVDPQALPAMMEVDYVRVYQPTK